MVILINLFFIEKNFIKNAIEIARRGYHYVKDQVLKFEWNVERSVFLKPRETATLKIIK